MFSLPRDGKHKSSILLIQTINQQFTAFIFTILRIFIRHAKIIKLFLSFKKILGDCHITLFESTNLVIQKLKQILIRFWVYSCNNIPWFLQLLYILNMLMIIFIHIDLKNMHSISSFNLPLSFFTSALSVVSSGIPISILFTIFLKSYSI